MSYKGSGNNIFGSENFDPEFIEYLYNLPAEFLDEMFMAWVMLKNNKGKIPVIDIDAVHRPKPISNKDISDFYNFIKNGKIDLTNLDKDNK